ncbi:DoxX family membrane protein [Planctomycetota bacterium]
MNQNQSSAPSTCVLRLALGYVFFHFGFLKFYPDLSTAEMLASQTIMRLSGGALDGRTAMWWLAILECSIGVGFLLNIGLRFVSALFLLHMIGTFVPVFVLPELAFQIRPFAPTFEGQYILKNVVFVAAGWTVLLPACLPNWNEASLSKSRLFKFGIASND